MTKVTLLFGAGTVDSSGNAARSAGWSESLYTDKLAGSSELEFDWRDLCTTRAALMPANVRIVGSRHQQVDPVGGSRSYDNTYVGSSTAGNALPGKALQWTVRSGVSPNQRSLTLRGIPDARVVTGEYAPSAGYNAALVAYFNELRTKWRFRCIDRTILPVRIVSISETGLMTTLAPHGLVVNDKVNIMSTRAGDRGTISYTATVGLPPVGFTAQLFMPGRNERIFESVGGRVRKSSISYPLISITNGEIIAPTAVFRKVGRPFRAFRGRRTAAH